MTVKTKQRMLTEDWEIFKQRRLIEDQVRLTGETCKLLHRKVALRYLSMLFVTGYH